jgi:hypothetical protein
VFNTWKVVVKVCGFIDIASKDEELFNKPLLLLDQCRLLLMPVTHHSSYTKGVVCIFHHFSSPTIIFTRFV